MLFKTTKSLFYGKYQYKIVLICAGASHFRNIDFDSTYNRLVEVGQVIDKISYYKTRGIKTQYELDYSFQLCSVLSGMDDIDIRVESPWVSVYSNSKDHINKLANINNDNVKYICEPANNLTLEAGTIIMPKVNFEYRATLGKTHSQHSAFVEWANGNPKLRLTKSCVRDLNKEHSWGGSYFYITGDNNLLMAKMHLGGVISKVERIIKA